MIAIELITRIKEDLTTLEALVTENTVFTEDNLQEFALYKEHKVGQIGLIDGVPYRVVIQKGCANCQSKGECSGHHLCAEGDRTDATGIIFKAL